MRKLSILLALLATAIALTAPAFALQSQKTYGQISLTFLITPSPVVYVPMTAPVAEIVALGKRMQKLQEFDHMLAWEPVRTNDMIAQANPQGSVEVNFTVKANPNYAYFHIIPGASTTFNAGYGPNVWTCAYSVFAHYTTAWSVTDWVYGSNGSGGTAGLNGFPVYNYPTTSLLDWLAETVTSTYTAFANHGSPGQTAFTGTAGSTKTVCFDLSLNVPSTIGAGSYQTTLQYNLYYSL